MKAKPRPVSPVCFEARLLRPAHRSDEDNWTFLKVPGEASAQFASRGLVSVEGTINGFSFQAALQPDGKGGHWLRVAEELRSGSQCEVGDIVVVEVRPALVEPEPEVPDDLMSAIRAAPPMALATWQDITPAARRDYVHWILSGKRAETRVKRISVAVSKLSAGNRRPCCFDRSGMYSNSMSCPIAED